MFRRHFPPPILAAGLLFSMFPRPAFAREPACSSVVTRSSISPCAVAASVDVRVGAVDKEVTAARALAARPWLPSNPVISASIATRRTDESPRATNWYATLAQEVELGGQRSARLSSAEADRSASSERFIGARRAAAAAAWKAYFAALASSEEVALATRMEALTAKVAETTQAFADRGAIAGLDADLADAVASRARQARIGAEGRVKASRAVLASLLAVPAESLEVQGELEPLRDVLAKARARGDAPRPELAALEWQAKASEARSRVFERQRIPNLTVSGFVQNDGFNEHVIGLGVALPIPLPGPVGRTFAGEIAEAQASARYARADAVRLGVTLRRETAVALAEYEARVAERDAISAEKFARLETTLTSLADEVKAGRMSPRDAFLAQQALIDLLQSRVTARRLACEASVELARVAGLPLEEGEP
jgi:outer membrane protein, heavy metal efflux system